MAVVYSFAHNMWIMWNMVFVFNKSGSVIRFSTKGNDTANLQTRNIAVLMGLCVFINALMSLVESVVGPLWTAEECFIWFWSFEKFSNFRFDFLILRRVQSSSGARRRQSGRHTGTIEIPANVITVPAVSHTHDTPTAQRKLQNVDRSSRWSAMEPFCLWFIIIIITGGNFKGNSLLHGDWQHRVTHRRIKRTDTKKSRKFPITCQQMQFECHHRWYSILLKSGSGWISYFFSATDREEEILSMGLCFVSRARACYLFLINEINEHQRSSNYYPLAIIICDNKDNSWFRFRVLWCEFCVIRVYSFWCDQFGEELLVNVQPAHYVPVPHRTVEPVLIKLEKGFKNNKDEWNGNRRNNNLNILLGTDRWNICRCMN